MEVRPRHHGAAALPHSGLRPADRAGQHQLPGAAADAAAPRLGVRRGAAPRRRPRAAAARHDRHRRHLALAGDAGLRQDQRGLGPASCSIAGCATTSRRCCRTPTATPIATPARAVSRSAPSSASPRRRAAAAHLQHYAPIPIFAVGCTIAIMDDRRLASARASMPHLVILYTRQSGSRDRHATCCAARLADAMLSAARRARATGLSHRRRAGVRLSGAHYAVADGQRDYAFVYLNLRMGRGRSAAVKQRAGEALLAAAKAHFAPLFATATSGSPCRSTRVRKCSTPSTAPSIRCSEAVNMLPAALVADLARQLVRGAQEPHRSCGSSRESTRR